jgi:hypothetical protein
MSEMLQNERLILGFSMLVFDNLLDGMTAEQAHQALILAHTVIQRQEMAYLTSELVNRIATYLLQRASKEEALAALGICTTVMVTAANIRAKIASCNAQQPPPK